GIRDFHVTGVQTCALPIFDNQIPEDSFAALAVAHEPVLRLTFSEPALTPVIDSDICQMERDGDDWTCRLSAPLSAGELIELDVTVDTSSIPSVPASGTTVTVT